MHTYRKRCVVAIVAMAIVGPIALFFQFDVPPPSTADVLKDIPVDIWPWAMVDERGPSEDEKRISGRRSSSSRLSRTQPGRQVPTPPTCIQEH